MYSNPLISRIFLKAAREIFFSQVPRPNGPAGIETGFGEFPWQAQVLMSSDQSPRCSGAILSDRTVVTAAHCLDE